MKRHVLPVVLVACALLTAFWLVMSQHSSRPFQPFDLTASAFSGYSPALRAADIEALPAVSRDPAEPNIISFLVHRDGRFLVRLVHGYNMPMCMKIKGYRVEALGRTEGALPCQIWRVTSSVNDVSVWVTTMIRAGDFAPTREDICSMAFPRVDIPDDPNWVPRGFSWSDVRHPVASLRRWFRARWNASRTDVLTFLRLRQPAWASDEILSYVTRSMSPDVTADNEQLVTSNTLEVHAEMLDSLRNWRKNASFGGAP